MIARKRNGPWHWATDGWVNHGVGGVLFVVIACTSQHLELYNEGLDGSVVFLTFGELAIDDPDNPVCKKCLRRWREAT
jgi:hypothetical protein